MAYFVTYVSIRTSDTSSMPHSTPSQAYRTLPYPTTHSVAAAASVHGICTRATMQRLKAENGNRIRKTRRRQFFLLMQRIRLYLFLTAIRLRKFILTLFSLYFTVSSERTEQFKVFLNFREYLMSVWA